MRHAITVDELSDFVEEKRRIWERFASSVSGDSVKTLEFSMGYVAPLYRVSCQGRDVYVGSLKETAVREYNALP